MTLFYIISFTLLFFIVFFYIGHYGFSEKILPLPPYPPNEKDIIENAHPFFLEGKSDVAFLIIHGFTGTPYNVKPIGEYFHNKGHTCLGILLPGHGTKVEDLVPTRFYHYVAISDQYLKKLKKYYKKVFVIGYSMGGAITLKLAQLRPNLINGIGLISTPVFFNGIYNGKIILHTPLMMLTGWIKMFIPLAKLRRTKKKIQHNPPRFIGYEHQYAIAALHSFKIALKSIRKNLYKIKVPSALVINESDQTVPKESMLYIMDNIKSTYKELLLINLIEPYETGHIIINNPKTKDQILKFFDNFFQPLI